MSALENAVQTLAESLDSLEARLEEQMSDVLAKSDAIDAANRQAATARAFVNTANEDVAASIKEIYALLGEEKKKDAPRSSAGDDATANAKEGA